MIFKPRGKASILNLIFRYLDIVIEVKYISRPIWYVLLAVVWTHIISWFQVKQIKNVFFMYWSKYAKNIFKNFGLEKERNKHILACTHVQITKDDQGVIMDQSLYRSMNWSLFYLNDSLLDITFFVGVCDRYQANPKVIHLIQVKGSSNIKMELVTMVSCNPMIPTII